MFIGMRKEIEYLELKSTLKESKELGDYYSDLNDVISQLLTLKYNRDKIKEWLKVKDSYNKIIARLDYYNEKKEYFRQLKSTIDSITNTVSVKNSLNKQVLKLRKQYDEKLKSAGVCPLCKRPW